MDLSSCLHLLSSPPGAFDPTNLLPGLAIALLIYGLVTRQLATIRDDGAGDEFGTVGETDEWLGGPTSEWLGV